MDSDDGGIGKHALPPQTTQQKITTGLQNNLKSSKRISKAAREKQIVTYKGVPIRLLADFSKETLQARRDWQEIFKVI